MKNLGSWVQKPLLNTNGSRTLVSLLTWKELVLVDSPCFLGVQTRVFWTGIEVCLNHLPTLFSKKASIQDSSVHKLIILSTKEVD